LLKNGVFVKLHVRRNRVAASSGISRRGTMVVVQHAAQTLTAQHCSTMTSFAFIGHNQAVPETLMVSLAVIVQNELVNPLQSRWKVPSPAVAQRRIPSGS
jgi:hypothetical protein